MKLSPLLAVYKDSDARTQLEASRGLVVNGVFALLALIFVVLNLSEPEAAIGSSVLFVGFVTSLILLTRGKFRASTSVHLAVVTIALPALYVLVMSVMIDFAIFTLVFCLFALTAAVIGVGRISLVIFTAVDLLSLGYRLIFGQTEIFVVDLSGIIEMLVLHLAIGIMALLQLRDRSSLVENVRVAMVESEKRANDLRGSVEVAGRSLDVGARLAEIARGTVREAEAMQKELRDGIGDLQETAEFTRGYQYEAGASMSEAASLTSLAENQSQAMIQTTSSLEELTASIRNIAAISQSKINILEKMVEAGKDGIKRMEQSDQAVKKVSEQAKDIQEVVAIIEDVASRTNLLAMNAAIEAAHAGDSGRGFAVVADEIRKLSTATSENTKRIQTSVKASLDGVASAVNIQVLSKESFVRLQTEVETMNDAFREIIESLQEMSQGTTEIMTAVTHIRDLSENQNRASLSISGYLENNTKRVQELAENAQKNIGRMERLNQAFGTIVTSSGEIRKLGEESESSIRSLRENLSRQD